MTTTPDLTTVRRWPNLCDEEVTRYGHAEPCEKPAVAVALDVYGTPYPVCVQHACGPMVTLAVLLGGDR